MDLCTRMTAIWHQIYLQLRSTGFVNRLEKLLCEQYNHDFNERATEEKGLSREDVQFMEIMENSAVLEDGHYSLKLPFKKENVSLPNNRSVAKPEEEISQ